MTWECQEFRKLRQHLASLRKTANNLPELRVENTDGISIAPALVSMRRISRPLLRNVAGANSLQQHNCMSRGLGSFGPACSCSSFHLRYLSDNGCDLFVLQFCI